MGALKKANIELNRKILSQLAAEYPKAFEKVIEAAKKKSKQINAKPFQDYLERFLILKKIDKPKITPKESIKTSIGEATRPETKP